MGLAIRHTVCITPHFYLVQHFWIPRSLQLNYIHMFRETLVFWWQSYLLGAKHSLFKANFALKKQVIICLFCWLFFFFHFVFLFGFWVVFFFPERERFIFCSDISEPIQILRTQKKLWHTVAGDRENKMWIRVSRSSG